MQFMTKYKIDSDEIWEVHGSTWVVKHKALERVAVEQGIVWLRPSVQVCDLTAKIAVICAFGKLGDREEWSFGEASPANNKNSYPVAMAEKRARDRVILKLLVTHGALYSESEADEFAEPPKVKTLMVRSVATPRVSNHQGEERQNPHVNRPADFYDTTHTSDIPESHGHVPKMKVKDARPEYAALVKEMQRYQDPAELREWATARADVINSLPGQWPEMFKGEYLKHKQSLSNGKAA
jgi:hypothetical protein